MSTRCSSHVLPGAKGMLPSAMMGESMSRQSVVLSLPSPSSMIRFVPPPPEMAPLVGVKALYQLENWMSGRAVPSGAVMPRRIRTT